MIRLDSLWIYPIKSLDGVALNQGQVLASGALKGDREFAIVDYQGKFVNGKRTAAIHHIRANFDLAARTVVLRRSDEAATDPFHLDRDRIPLEGWLSACLGFPVNLIQNGEMGFPDDTASPGPTLISTSTLQAVANWFPELNLNNIRLRLRTNLEISGAEAFWEERLYTTAGNLIPFEIGAVQLLGVNPCQRCIVPTRDPVTGVPYANFQKVLSENRKRTLPEWAEASRFNHYYRLAINTRVRSGEGGKVLQVGDIVRELSAE